MSGQNLSDQIFARYELAIQRPAQALDPQLAKGIGY